MEIKQLIIKSIYGQLDAEEQARLDAWLEVDSKNRSVYDRIHTCLTERDAIRFLASVDTEQALARLHRKRLWAQGRKWLAAASVAAVIALGVFFLPRPTEKQVLVFQPAETSYATLTLASGERLALDKSANSLQATGQSIQLANDSIQIGGSVPATTSALNILTVPHGECFDVTLEDGTHIWVNALSTLKFPSSFAGAKERIVELDGEGFFDVAHDTRRPFRVITPRQHICVTGTAFNVCAYPDEEERTTLCEGHVYIETTDKKHIDLTPGEQLVARLEGGIEVRTVDTSVYTAWTKGVYSFDKLSLHDVFVVLSKWYDISQVTFKDKMMGERLFSGKFYKADGLEPILRVIGKGSGCDITCHDGKIELQ